MLSQTYNLGSETNSFSNVPIGNINNADPDTLITERRDVSSFADNNASST
jgi:hypothetical protein